MGGERVMEDCYHPFAIKYTGFAIKYTGDHHALRVCYQVYGGSPCRM